MPNSSLIKSFETSAHRFTLRGDGFIRVYSKPEEIIVDNVKEFFEMLKMISNGDKLLIILNPIEEKSMTKEARKMITSSLGQYAKGFAVINRKKAIQVIGNMMIKFDKIDYHFKMFEEEFEAEAWLKTL